VSVGTQHLTGFARRATDLGTCRASIRVESAHATYLPNAPSSTGATNPRTRSTVSIDSVVDGWARLTSLIQLDMFSKAATARPTPPSLRLSTTLRGALDSIQSGVAACRGSCRHPSRRAGPRRRRHHLRCCQGRNGNRCPKTDHDAGALA